MTTLKVSDTASMGPVVTDASGYTLYRFDQDPVNPPASSCEGRCAGTWPPARIGDGQVVTQGIDQGLVAKVMRPDGTWQLTLAGRPLYRFSGDEAPGDVKGEGVGGKWFATAPDGAKARAAVDNGAGAGADSGNSGGGY